MKKDNALIIAACFSGIGICYGLQYSFSIFFVEITKYFHCSKGAGSLIFSITLLIYGLYSPVISILTNRFGGRKIFKIAGLLIITGLLSSSFATNIFQLYFTIGIVTAIGMNSVGFVPAVIILTNSFKEQRGMALGIATTGVGIGAIIFSILSKFLINIFSWQQALIILGTLSFIVVFGMSFFLPNSTNKNSINFDFSFFKQKEFWFIQGGMACGAMTSQSIMLHVVSCFLDKGAKETLAVLSVSIIAVAGSIGKILWGALSDFFKPIYLYIFSCFIIMIGLFLLLLSDTPIHTYVVILFPILFGIGYGAFAPLFPVLAYEVFKEKFANVLGFLTMANGIGSFFSTFLMGYFFDITGNYNLSLKFLMFLISMSILLFSLAFKLHKSI
jgi:MFS family permease